jgi:hypothetical protein
MVHDGDRISGVEGVVGVGKVFSVINVIVNMGIGFPGLVDDGSGNIDPP